MLLVLLDRMVAVIDAAAMVKDERRCLLLPRRRFRRWLCDGMMQGMDLSIVVGMMDWIDWIKR